MQVFKSSPSQLSDARPRTRLTLSSSVATRDSRSELRSPLAAPSLRPSECEHSWLSLLPRFMTVIYSMEYEQGTTEKTTEKILSLIAENPSVTTEELAKLCGLTPDGVYYHTKRLREKGVLIREGGRKEGSWIIVEKK